MKSRSRGILLLVIWGISFHLFGAILVVQKVYTSLYPTETSSQWGWLIPVLIICSVMVYSALMMIAIRKCAKAEKRKWLIITATILLLYFLLMLVAWVIGLLISLA